MVQASMSFVVCQQITSRAAGHKVMVACMGSLKMDIRIQRELDSICEIHKHACLK